MRLPVAACQRTSNLLFFVLHPPQSGAAHAELDRCLALISMDASQGNLYQFAGHLLQRTICVKRRSLGRRLRGLQQQLLSDAFGGNIGSFRRQRQLSYDAF